jgi:hypothetical protein
MAPTKTLANTSCLRPTAATATGSMALQSSPVKFAEFAKLDIHTSSVNKVILVGNIGKNRRPLIAVGERRSIHLSCSLGYRDEGIIEFVKDDLNRRVIATDAESGIDVIASETIERLFGIRVVCRNCHREPNG